jgi:signal transduction histidine kinase
VVDLVNFEQGSSDEGSDNLMPVARDTFAQMHELMGMVIQGKPLLDIVREVLAAMKAKMGFRDVELTLRFSELADQSPELKAILGPEPNGSSHLRQGDRVSPNGFFTRADELLRFFTGEFVAGSEFWQPDDRLTIVARGSSGEPVATIQVGGTESGLLPSMANLECADLLAQVLGFSIDRERERNNIDDRSLNVIRKADLLEDILRIASAIVSERHLQRVTEMVLSSVSSLFGFEKVALVIYDEAAGAFKWADMFGYSDEQVKSTKTRFIPMEVILEDLRENRRIGRTAYFTPFEEISDKGKQHFIDYEQVASSLKESPKKPNEFREGDMIAFALHDSSGRVVGVLYPSVPKEKRFPDRDTIEMIEVFTYLAEVAIENARLTEERETALRLSNLRTEQMSRIFDTISDILTIRNLGQLLDEVLRTLAQLVGVKRMVFALRSEDGRMFRVKAVHGYMEDRARDVMDTEYSIESVEAVLHPDRIKSADSNVKWSRKVGRMTYYIPAESVKLDPWEMVYYPEPELLRLPRKSKEHWHELDYMDTYIRNNAGEVVAYIEILKPRDDHVPDRETIELIEVFASLVGIALENARMVEGHINSRKSAEFYTDLLSHDIKNFNQAIMGYLDLLRAGLNRPEQTAYIEKVNEQVININRLAADVRTMSRLTFSATTLAMVDIGKVMVDSMESIRQYFLSRKIVYHRDFEVGVYHSKADDLIRELFINLLTNAVKYDPNNPVVIDVSIEKIEVKHGHRLIISIADHGRGVPDNLKQEIFERFSKAPRKKGSGLGLHIVKTLAARYHGRAWVEDRVKGEHTKGAVFKVELPSFD